MNKELGYLLLRIEWPTDYESQLKKKFPWLERKQKQKERKKRDSQKVAEQKETKRNKAGHQ